MIKFYFIFVKMFISPEFSGPNMVYIPPHNSCIACLSATTLLV